MDAITPRKAILLQKTQSFVEQARASADNEIVENKALKEGKKHEKPPNTKRKALKKHKSDTFEVTTKPKLVPQPVIITTKVDPASNRGTLVLATMGFIASLGAVFGVGVLLAKSNQAEEAMATRFTNLEQAITTEWGNNTLLLGKYLQENANEVLASSSEALKDLNEAMILMTQSFNKNSTELDKLYQRMDKLDRFVDEINKERANAQHVIRAEYEKQLSFNAKRGGQEGFVEAYLEDSRKALPTVVERLAEIKDRQAGIKWLNNLADINKPCERLLMLIEVLDNNQKANPSILNLLLEETKVILKEIAELPSTTDSKKQAISESLRNFILYQKGLELYENPNLSFTEEEKAWILQSAENRDLPCTWLEKMDYCREYHFSIAPETSEWVNLLTLFLEQHNKG
jgi:hypothetical protein